MLEGANMEAAAYVSPDEKDFQHHENIRQSMLLRFAIAAVWFFIVGTAQVSSSLGLSHLAVCRHQSALLQCRWFKEVALTMHTGAAVSLQWELEMYCVSLDLLTFDCLSAGAMHRLFIRVFVCV